MNTPGTHPEGQARTRSTFFKDVLTLASGTTTAQLLSLVSAPFVTRLFAPEAFGLAALFAAMNVILGVIVCLRYEKSILLAEEDDEALNAAALSLCCAVAIALLTSIGVALVSEHLQRWLKAPQLGSYLWLLPLGVILSGCSTVLEHWNTRRRRFGRFAVAQLSGTISSIAMKLAAGLAGYVGGGILILSALFGMFVAVTTLGASSWKDHSFRILRCIRWKKIVYVSKRYSRFVKYTTFASLMNYTSRQLPNFVLAAFFSPQVVGQYALGNRVLRTPMELIGANIGRVFFQRAAEAKLQGNLAASVERAFRYLASVSVIPCLMLSLVGKELFVVLFGSRWSEAGVYAQILSLWLGVWFVSGPLHNLFSVLEEQSAEMGVQSLIFVTRVGSLLIGGTLGSARLALVLFSLTGILVYGYSILVIFKKCGLPRSLVFRGVGTQVLSFLPAGAIVLLLKYFGSPPLLVAVVASVFVAIYVFNALRVHPESRRLIDGAFRRMSLQRAR
jgi:O-antigen/teichoic acid export membrane protein